MRQTLWLFLSLFTDHHFERNGCNWANWRESKSWYPWYFSLFDFGFVRYFSFRAVFNWLSKVIKVCISFSLLRSVIGPENSRNSLNQSYAKQKPISTWSPAFSRALGSFHCFTLSSHWRVLSSHLIGRSDNFQFGFTAPNRKAFCCFDMNYLGKFLTRGNRAILLWCLQFMFMLPKFISVLSHSRRGILIYHRMATISR